MQQGVRFGFLAIAVGVLLACGNGNPYPVLSARNAQNKRFARIFPASAAEDAFQRATVREHLVAEPWVGLDARQKPRTDTSLSFYDDRYDTATDQFRYQFDLLLAGKALRGVIHERRAPDGSLRGQIQTSEDYISVPMCLPPSPLLTAQGVDANGVAHIGKVYRPRDYIFRGAQYPGWRCYGDSSPDLEGSRLKFGVVLSDAGALLRMTLDQGTWDFQEQSVARKRTQATPTKK